MDDPYARLDYRKLIPWPKRLEREWSFLRPLLEAAPSRRILDLGCGTGEHARFLADRGFDVVGVDASPGMIQAAIESGEQAGVRYVLGDLADVRSLVEGTFGAAICLGNTLPHLHDDEAVSQFFKGLRGLLAPPGPFILQLLNYERIAATGQRSLPLTFIPDAAGEVIFLRLLEPQPDGTVVFVPATLSYRPEEDPPLQVLGARTVRHRGWKRPELEELLEQAGFRHRLLHGTVADVPYVTLESTDLVIVSR
jgi:glycine/sarcosine N-methyltransferase